MVKAVANCKCKYCGKEFQKVAIRGNRRDADNFVAWAEEHCDQCPECYAEAQKANDAKVFAELNEKYHFPEIVGVSDKQKAYAETRRKRYVMTDIGEIKHAKAYLNNIDRNVLANMVKESSKDEETILREFFRSIHLLEAYIALTCTDAHTIIEKL